MVDSYSPLLVEIQFVGASRPVRLRTFPQTTKGGGDVPIITTDYLRSFRAEYSLESVWSGTLVLFDTDFDVLEEMLTPLNHADRIVKIRWGFDTGSGLQNSPWLQGMITEWDTTYTFEGAEFSFTLMPYVGVAPLIDKLSRSFKEGANPTDIVLEIAEARDWKIIDAHGVPTVERALSTFDKPLQQHNESDMRFIREKVLPQAKDAEGRGFYFYVDMQDVVHFHSRQHLLANRANPRVAASYTYGRNVQGEVISFTPQAGNMFSTLVGGENALYVFTDERTGRKGEIRTTKDGGPDNVIVSYPDEKAREGLGGGTKAKIVLPARTEEEARAQVAVRYSKARLMGYAATLEVRGTHTVNAGDHISIRFVKRDSTDHYLSGVYWVKGVQHDVSAGQWVTVFDLVRAGMRATATTPETDVIAPSTTQVSQVSQVSQEVPTLRKIQRIEEEASEYQPATAEQATKLSEAKKQFSRTPAEIISKKVK